MEKKSKQTCLVDRVPALDGMVDKTGSLDAERRVLGIIKARSFLARLEEWFLNSSKTQYGSLNLSIL